jgi:hypothetical protein
VLGVGVGLLCSCSEKPEGLAVEEFSAVFSRSLQPESRSVNENAPTSKRARHGILFIAIEFSFQAVSFKIISCLQ